MMRLLLVALVALATVIPAAADAQNSVYAVHGIGFLGRPIGTRSRATGGGLAAFDPRAALNPAAAAGFRSVSVTGSIGTTMRSYTALGASASGLNETRVPFGQLAGWVRGTPVSFSITYYPYAERSYNLVTTDTISIRGGDSVEVSDQISSDGAVANVGGALAFRISSRLNVGAALHIITGSAAAAALRTFTSDDYMLAAERIKLGFNGLGFSVGAVAALHPRLILAAAFRSDTRLETIADSVSVSRIQLPVTASAGIRLIPHRAVHWATTVVYQWWSDAVSDLAALGAATAFDTWEVSSGFEIGGAAVGSPIPVRLGFRYAQLPFSPTDDQPREIDVSLGSGVDFASDRAAIEFSVERIFREGAGADERAWYLTLSVTLRP
ncbi:MAG: hypothetical protein JSW71_02345 [Gemmatimonadota bacterium]|nr:MAG: hypothetical protein JSW71_02345 [Gemmatimonadota bacterium]